MAQTHQLSPKLKAQKEARDFLDRNILSLDAALANAELRELFLWADESLDNGDALHIIVEDGNLKDDDIEYCENQITSGEWKKDCKEYGISYTDEHNQKMLRILELMKPLTLEQREMIYTGNTITEDLFDLLYNQCCETE